MSLGKGDSWWHLAFGGFSWCRWPFCWRLAARIMLVPALCETATYENHPYVICTVQPDRHDIRLFLDDPDGSPFGDYETTPAASLE